MRILIEVAAPAFVGTMYFLALSVGELQIPTTLAWIPTFLLGLCLAYPAAAGPSLVYALLMEWAFSRGLSQQGWGQVAYSTFLGGIAGFMIAWIVNGNIGLKATGEHPYGLFFVGTLTGFTIGLAFKFLPEAQRKTPATKLS